MYVDQSLVVHMCVDHNLLLQHVTNRTLVTACRYQTSLGDTFSKQVGYTKTAVSNKVVKPTAVVVLQERGTVGTGLVPGPLLQEICLPGCACLIQQHMQHLQHYVLQPHGAHSNPACTTVY